MAAHLKYSSASHEKVTTIKTVMSYIYNIQNGNEDKIIIETEAINFIMEKYKDITKWNQIHGLR